MVPGQRKTYRVNGTTQFADVLGHDGTRMTALVYRHVVSPTIDDAVAMGEVLG